MKLIGIQGTSLVRTHFIRLLERLSQINCYWPILREKYLCTVTRHCFLAFVCIGRDYKLRMALATIDKDIRGFDSVTTVSGSHIPDRILADGLMGHSLHCKSEKKFFITSKKVTKLLLRKSS